ncbi:MAG: 23S rRNA (uracil(1939)-C(5))-methyltransferase RlmD [Lachnospiraceae bacterium]|nr:23S rRNA (uracil(1939)-C(5))-methyltransferase RlmD [Lachnospiraceae bacterium]
MNRKIEYKKNDLVTVTIEDISNEGEGIGKVDGFTLFIKDAIIGDTVEAKIIKSKKHYAYARLEKVISPSSFRVEPKCKFHRQCGGCQIQAMSYEKQLEFKQQKIKNNLIRIGGFDEVLIDSLMEPIIGMDNPYHYRNKAQYPVGVDREGQIITGFYAGHTHSIIANTSCLLGIKENEEILNAVLFYMRENNVSVYNEAAGTGLVRHVLIRTGFTSHEIMVCLVLNYSGDKACHSGNYERGQAERRLKPLEFLPCQDKLIKALCKIKNMTSVSVSINNERTNVIMGKEIHTIWGKDTISDTIHVRDMSKKEYPRTGQALTFNISPLSFYQINPVQTEKLYSLALSYSGLTGKEIVWDLYCGIGTISLFLSTKAKRVYGIEVVPQAIEDARSNAEVNNIKNVEFFVGRAEEVLPEFYEKMPDCQSMLHPNVIVVDPPRKGCDEACLDTMLKMKPERIVYVSCDSATLARDLKILCDGGYEIKKVRGVDQFGQTVHVETVVLLGNQKSERT